MTGNINDRRPSNKPSARTRVGQSSQRKIIADIETTLQKTPPRKFTGESIGVLADKVNKTIIWLRSPQADGVISKANKEALRTYLRNAITKLNTASVEYGKPRGAEKFFNNIEAGRKELSNALKFWK